VDEARHDVGARIENTKTAEQKRPHVFVPRPGVRRDGVQDEALAGSGRHLERLEIGRVPATA
jgi:hypothetical protein